MAKCFQLSVMTADGSALSGQAEYCNLPVQEGSVGILADHAPMLCAIREGTAHFRMDGGEEKTVRLSAGVAEIRNNRVTVLVDRADL